MKRDFRSVSVFLSSLIARLYRPDRKLRSTGSQSQVTRDQIDQTENDELSDLFHDLCLFIDIARLRL